MSPAWDAMLKHRIDQRDKELRRKATQASIANAKERLEITKNADKRSQEQHIMNMQNNDRQKEVFDVEMRRLLWTEENLDPETLALRKQQRENSVKNLELLNSQLSREPDINKRVAIEAQIAEETKNARVSQARDNADFAKAQAQIATFEASGIEKQRILRDQQSYMSTINSRNGMLANGRAVLSSSRSPESFEAKKNAMLAHFSSPEMGGPDSEHVKQIKTFEYEDFQEKKALTAEDWILKDVQRVDKLIEEGRQAGVSEKKLAVLSAKKEALLGRTEALLDVLDVGTIKEAAEMESTIRGEIRQSRLKGDYKNTNFKYWIDPNGLPNTPEAFFLNSPPGELYYDIINSDVVKDGFSLTSREVVGLVSNPSHRERLRKAYNSKELGKTPKERIQKAIGMITEREPETWKPLPNRDPSEWKKYDPESVAKKVKGGLQLTQSGLRQKAWEQEYRQVSEGSFGLGRGKSLNPVMLLHDFFKRGGLNPLGDSMTQGPKKKFMDEKMRELRAAGGKP